MHIGVTSHLWLKSALHASSHPCMCTCVLRCGCFLLARLCSLLRPTVLLPALPDVHLSVQREVQVQLPVRLPLGDRGHLRPRDTPHRGCGRGSQANLERSKRRKRTTYFGDFRLGRHELPGGGVVQMGQIQKSNMETRFVGLCKRWMAARSLGTADSQLEPS